MSQIFLSSDYHFNHDREFIYKTRGYNSVQEMNEGLIYKHNSLVSKDDIVYCLGDLSLGKNLQSNKELIEKLNGRIHIITGNHDTVNCIDMYCSCNNVISIEPAAYLTYGKFHFFLTHYPCFTGNMDDMGLKNRIFNLYGHTHQSSNFYNDIFFMYHCGIDSHNGYPVAIDDIIADIKEKYVADLSP